MIDAIFRRFEESQEFGLVSELHRKYHIPVSTLARWRQKHAEDSEWRPYNTSVHGLHHRIFSDAQEAAIKEFVFDNYIKPGIIFRNRDFPKIAMQAFLENFGDDDELKDFRCSGHFVRDFMRRQNISLRRAHVKRRPVRNQSPDDIEKWVGEVKQLLATVPNDRVLNGNETGWKIAPNNLHTWAESGSDNIQVKCQDDDKKSLTVMATVSASGTRLPLFVISKGATERSERSQIGDIYPHFTSHSTASWMTTECFKEYLSMLREQYKGGEELYLILDSFSVHKSAAVQEFATGLNIHLMFIPAGMTDKLQPLDVRIFGVMKSIARSYLVREMQELADQKIGMPKAIQILVRSWEQLSSETITSAWSVYRDHPAD